MKVKPSDINYKSNELHSSVRNLLHQYRWFGFFPVEGLGEEDSSKLRYNLRSIYTIYYIISIIGQIMMMSFSFFSFLERNKTLNTLAYLLFYGAVVLAISYTIRLSKNWPKLMRKTAEIEEKLADIRISKYIPTKCYIMAHFLMIFTYIEHLLCKIYNGKIVMTCLKETVLSEEVVKKYFHYRYYYLFDYIPLNPLTAMMSELLCLQTTFVWSFPDVLVICISIYLTSYFNDLNEAINSYQKESIIPWAKLRAQYADLVILLKQINSQLQSVLMVSFVSNLFFLCYQLFNVLHAMPSSESLVYYVFSSVFLVVRSLTLFFVAANVHKAAKGPLVALYEVPTSTYNMEVQRFQLQLRYTTIGLSGLFFYVTRKTILRVVRTLITYELILLQFNNNTTLMSSGISSMSTYIIVH